MLRRLFNLIVPDRARETVRFHPLALWFSLGICLIGLVQIFNPQPTPTALLLPEWLRIAFNVTWFIGGAASLLGLLRGLARFEAAGMILLATGLLVNLVTTIWIAPGQALTSGVFVAALAIGCGIRGLVLARRGHEIIVPDERWTR